MMADGLVVRGHMVVKRNANKLRTHKKSNTIIGLSGSTSDTLTLLHLFEERLNDTPHNLLRACTDLVKHWRTAQRNLQAELIVASKDQIYVVSGAGLCLEADRGIASAGEGGHYARAAAHALIALPEAASLTAAEICKRAMDIAVDLDSQSNNCYNTLQLEFKEGELDKPKYVKPADVYGTGTAKKDESAKKDNKVDVAAPAEAAPPAGADAAAPSDAAPIADAAPPADAQPSDVADGDKGAAEGSTAAATEQSAVAPPSETTESPDAATQQGNDDKGRGRNPE